MVIWEAATAYFQAVSWHCSGDKYYKILNNKELVF